MARAAERLRKVTIAEFDEIAEKATEARDYELIDGEIVMMTNPRRRTSRSLRTSAPA